MPTGENDTPHFDLAEAMHYELTDHVPMPNRHINFVTCVTRDKSKGSYLTLVKSALHNTHRQT